MMGVTSFILLQCTIYYYYYYVAGLGFGHNFFIYMYILYTFIKYLRIGKLLQSTINVYIIRQTRLHTITYTNGLRWMCIIVPTVTGVSVKNYFQMQFHKLSFIIHSDQSYLLTLIRWCISLWYLQFLNFK